jgi:hypothetical protein
MEPVENGKKVISDTQRGKKKMNKHLQIQISISIMCILAGAIYFAIVQNSPLVPSSTVGNCDRSITSGCSVITVSKGNQVFFGGNDDYINPDSYYWVDPGSATKYGAIWIGKPDNVQQGVNEKGLAYDANGVPRADVNPHLERKPALGGYSYYPIQILHECATVKEVIEWVNTHRWHTYMHDQLHFADASGDAVIISAGKDGELVFTRKPPGDSFLVSTNFNVANPSSGNYPCDRYETATKRLSELVKLEGDLTAAEATAVLQAVSTAGGSSWTLESLVADLPHGLVYLYYFRQFDKPVVLSVADEIANPRPQGPLSKLFSEEVQQEATRRYQQALSKQGICAWITKTWACMLIISLIVIIVLSLRKPRSLLYWLPVTIILGPIALLVKLISGQKKITPQAQFALLEATGNIPAIAVVYLLFLMVLIILPQAQTNSLLQAMFIFILPLLLGWLFYQGPLLAIAARQGYIRTLGQRLPAAWVVANLGVAGLNSLAPRLLKWISNTCSVMNLSVWSYGSIWVVVVAGACLGLLLILLYEVWATYHGYRALSVLASGSGEVNSPTWRRLWWWILLSYVLLASSIILIS